MRGGAVRLGRLSVPFERFTVLVLRFHAFRQPEFYASVECCTVVMLVAESERLAVRRLTPDDAPFILELVNDPDWLRYIGDKHVHSLEDARGYIEREGTQKYLQPPLGLNLVETRHDHVPIGICGLKKRDALEYPDLGFAFLPTFRGSGYAFEACRALMMQVTVDAIRAQDYQPIHLLAITTEDNHASMQLLERLGFGFLHPVTFPGSVTPLRLYNVTMEGVNAVK